MGRRVDVRLGQSVRHILSDLILAVVEAAWMLSDDTLGPEAIDAVLIPEDHRMLGIRAPIGFYLTQLLRETHIVLVGSRASKHKAAAQFTYYLICVARRDLVLFQIRITLGEVNAHVGSYGRWLMEFLDWSGNYCWLLFNESLLMLLLNLWLIEVQKEWLGSFEAEHFS